MAVSGIELDIACASGRSAGGLGPKVFETVGYAHQHTARITGRRVFDRLRGGLQHTGHSNTGSTAIEMKFEFDR